MSDWTPHPGDDYDEAVRNLTALIDVTQLASYADEVSKQSISSVTILMQRELQAMADAQEQMQAMQEAKEQTPPKKKAAVGAAASV